MELTLSRVYEEAELRTKNVLYAFILCVGLVIEAWEMVIVGFLMPGIAEEFQLNASQTGFMASTLYIGMLVGAYVFGPFGEKYGRKITYSIGLCGYAIFTIICALSGGYYMFLVLRFLSGMMFAGLAVVIFPYYEELIPNKYRGNLTPLLAAGWPVGTLAAAFLSRSIIPNMGWRSALLISGCVGFWGLITYFIVPESPLWLAAKGKIDQAKHSVSILFPEMKVHENELIIEPPEHETQGSLTDLFKPKFKKLTVQVFLVNFVYAWAYWGLFLWLPTILIDRGFSYFGSSNFMIASACAQIPGYLVAAWLTRKYGRKQTLIPFVAGAAVFGVVFAASHNMNLALLAFAIMSFFNLGGWGIWNTWMSELFPTLLRNTGTGWGIASQKWANIIAPIVNGALIGMGAGLPVIVGIAVVFLIITMIVCRGFKETEGVSLT